MLCEYNERRGQESKKYKQRVFTKTEQGIYYIWDKEYEYNFTEENLYRCYKDVFEEFKEDGENVVRVDNDEEFEKRLTEEDL